MKRSIYCGAVREADIGSEHTACGWVQTKRDMGGVIFLDLRDREGILQVVCNAMYLAAEAFHTAEGLKNESVIAVRGKIRLRDEETVNRKIETGTIELLAEEIEVLSAAGPLPYHLEEGTAVREDLRLAYRFLDIRRPQILNNLKFRHTVQAAAERFLDQNGFIQVETPILTKSTPEGARDYLVPSRVHPGTFYALPQSPQIFKQLLMVGGIDKYYQIAKCFRDEDLRADRQPEFTQVDMELSFVDQEDILQHLEQLFRYLFRETMGITFPAAFPRITWQEAMERYGSDKPDLRFGLPITDITDIALKCDFSVFRQAAEKGGAVRAINVKGCADFSRSTIEDLTQKAMHYGAGGMAWIAIRPDGELYSVLTKYFSKEEMDELLCRIAGEPGDFILFCADKPAAVCRILGNLRLDLGDLLKLRPKDRFAFVVVTDFPLFEYSEEEGRYVAAHHPFTMPYPEDIPRMRTDPASVRAQAYDIVLNGVELGSGSIRIHRPDIQQLMFEVLGFTEDEIRERFGFLINAFRYGTPPHGGFAFGLDRLVMLMRGADSLRDVIAFPKMKDASCPLTGAPDFVDREQLEILRLLQNEADGMQAGTASRQHKTRPAVSAEKVANLAKLKLSEQERGAIESELNRIIAFADQLSEIPTAEIPITAHVAPMKNVWRADAVQPPFDRDLLLSSTPKKENGFVVM